MKELRDAYEHADDRALGYIYRNQKDPKKARNAIAAFGSTLVKQEEIRYRKWSLGIGKPATDIFLALRRFLRKAWLELSHEDWKRRHGGNT